MKSQYPRVVSEPIEQLRQQLAQFRSVNRRRAKLPEPLWQAAVEVARQHGLWQTAKTLGLDYMGLKRRLGGADKPRRKAARPAFVELIAPRQGTVEGYEVEFASESGGKMWVRWKATVAPDWTSLLRAWRETQG